MNTAIATTLISVLGAGLFGMFFHFMRVVNAKLDKIGDDVAGLDAKFTGQIKDLEIRLIDKFTGQIKDLDAKFTGQIKDLDAKFTGQIKELDAKFTGQINAQGRRIDGIYDALRDHGERLARIEAKLDIDPTAEAA